MGYYICDFTFKIPLSTPLLQVLFPHIYITLTSMNFYKEIINDVAVVIRVNL